MDEIKPKDVLRLFFGKEHKHYLVIKVGSNTIKLKNDHGNNVVLKHTDGKIERLGDAVITGFEVLRDPNRYASYRIGSEVSVRMHDGKTFRGDILENDDGLLKIKTNSGNEWYVDLDTKDKVELVGSILPDEMDDVKLPDEIDELFFLKLHKDSGSRRVFEYYRTNSKEAPVPFWIVPILDPHKCRLNIHQTGSFDDTLFFTSAGKEVITRTEVVLFNQTVFPDRVKETYAYTAEKNEKVPIVEYALMVPFAQHAGVTFINPNWGIRLANPTPETKRFESVRDAVAAFTPSIIGAGSGFDAALLLYPLPLRVGDVERIEPPKHDDKEKGKGKVKASLSKRSHTTRSALAAAYNGKIEIHLTTSETLSRMFDYDYAMAYFGKQAAAQLKPSSVDKKWALEQFGQRMKAGRNKLEAYAKEAVAVINELYDLLHRGEYSDFLRIVQEYGRIAKQEENQAYLYFTTPVHSKYVLIPCAAEHLARMTLLRGKSGMNVAMKSFVMEDGMLLERASGLVFHRDFESTLGLDCVTTLCAGDEIPEEVIERTYSEDELIILNLAKRLVRELGLQLPHEVETKLLNAVRIDGKQPYRNACTIAAFIAHHGNIGLGVAAEALRKVAKRKVWSAVNDSKELTADISKAAAKLIEKREPTQIPQNTPMLIMAKKPETALASLPAFERVEVMQPKLLRPAAVEPKWTILPQVHAKDYHFVADVFAPDRTALASLEHCTPTVMAVLAPSEKSFFKHLGETTLLTALYEFVSNLACVVPALLISGRRDFQEHVFPTDSQNSKRNTAFMTVWAKYYAALLTVSVAEAPNDVAARFAMQYGQKSSTFQRLLAVAKTALTKKDEQMMQACAVRAAFLHLSDNMSEEMEAYVVKVVRACIEMYRQHSDTHLLTPNFVKLRETWRPVP